MLKEYMISLGYKENEIDKIRNTYPVVKCGDEYLCISVKDLFKLFLNYGYSKSQIMKMTIERPQLFCLIDVLEGKMNHYEKLLGNKKIVIKVTVDYPTLYSYDMDSVDNKIEELIKLGYKRDIIIKNIKNYPELLGLSIEDNIKKIIKDLEKIGFTLKDVLKITSKNMSIFGRDIESIKDTIKKLESFGYSRKDVISMIKKHPAILNYAISRLEQRINDMSLLMVIKKWH